MASGQRGASVEAAVLATVAILSGIVGVGCSQRSGTPAAGDVRVALVLPSGATITTVAYRILNSSGATIVGPASLSVSDPQATASLDIDVPPTPPGDPGDHVQLNATDSTGDSCSGTSAPFPVVAGSDAAVTMTLTCSTPGNGTGTLGITVNEVQGQCPVITSAVVSPAESSVGTQVAVGVTATDANSAETLTYVWGPPGNSFLFANTPVSTYTCTSVGTQSISVTVTDSVNLCSTTATVTVRCDSPSSDGGASCNPDAGAASWTFFGQPLSVSSYGAYLPAMALLPDGSPVVAWTDAQPGSARAQFASFNSASRIYTVVWQPDGCDGTWQAMGAPVPGTLPALLVPSGSNQPLRAWVSNDEPSVLTVERWNGTAFEALGAPFQALNESIFSPVMVADASGNPILGWIDGPYNSNVQTVQVAHWNGSEWQMLTSAAGVPGGAPNTFFGTARALSLAIYPGGSPLVAWVGSQGTNVAIFDTVTKWTILGRAPNTLVNYTVNGPVVRVNAAGAIFLAWYFTQQLGADVENHVSVSSFGGTTWAELGGPLASAEYYSAGDYDMTIDSSGAPVVADAEYPGNGGEQLFTYRWNGTAWQTLAPGVAAGPLSTTYAMNPAIAIDGRGRTVAAWVNLNQSQIATNDPNNINTTAIAVARYQP
jgi:hypothetical protein